MTQIRSSQQTQQAAQMTQQTQEASQPIEVPATTQATNTQTAARRTGRTVLGTPFPSLRSLQANPADIEGDTSDEAVQDIVNASQSAQYSAEAHQQLQLPNQPTQHHQAAPPVAPENLSLKRASKQL
ncbi:hypothetical protein PtB15_7B349 [Puccinia triticina]|nr:hypothetical protein PtB15_7B349 [Puccinia triticina]